MIIVNYSPKYDEIKQIFFINILNKYKMIDNHHPSNFTVQTQYLLKVRYKIGW